MIEVKNLSKSFDAIKAIDHISAHIEEGHVFGLIGTNGAGKSTFMRMMSGVLKPDEGEIRGLCSASRCIMDGKEISYFLSPDVVREICRNGGIFLCKKQLCSGVPPIRN